MYPYWCHLDEIHVGFHASSSSCAVGGASSSWSLESWSRFGKLYHCYCGNLYLSLRDQETSPRSSHTISSRFSRRYTITFFTHEVVVCGASNVWVRSSVQWSTSEVNRAHATCDILQSGDGCFKNVLPTKNRKPPKTFATAYAKWSHGDALKWMKTLQASDNALNKEQESFMQRVIHRCDMEANSHHLDYVKLCWEDIPIIFDLKSAKMYLHFATDHEVKDVLTCTRVYNLYIYIYKL